jgi:cytochrome c biogenesis protein CcdA/thiol-disulfide isomerase/thioredoxin
MNLALLGTAFVGGLVSFIAPCILPIIPGFLAYLAGSSSIGGNEPKRKEIFLNSLFFVLGFSVVFALLGILLNTVLANVGATVETWLARFGGVVVIFFGLYLVGLVHLSFLDKEHKLGVKVRFSSRYLTSFLFGLAFAAGWTPCVGPVLGVVLGLAASAPGSAFVLLLAYALGLGVPFLLVGLFTGEATKLIARFGASLKIVNIIFGVILIILGVLVFTQRLSFTLHMPTSTTPAVTVTAPTFATSTASAVAPIVIDHTGDYLAKEITDPSGFINTPGDLPITISQYIGKKVILLDFWTYSCINCQRTVPYLESWYTKYEDQGLVIIGIHTPEFDFEKDYNNVSSAVKRLGITFPVVMDNDYGTWNAYDNHYWPHKYLIDIDGYVTFDSIGEGNYAEDEAEIQKALTERAEVLGTGQTISGGLVNPAGATDIEANSPETYFGSARNEYMGNGTQAVAGTQTFTFPQTITPNMFYLSGTWDVEGEYAQSSSETSGIKYTYNAKDIYFVAGATTPVVVDVIQDGIKVNTLTISDDKLYTLVQNQTAGTHTIELQVQGSGLQAYTFTFG